jgi:hypothetical protein
MVIGVDGDGRTVTLTEAAEDRRFYTPLARSGTAIALVVSPRIHGRLD